ncbi:RHS repeat-associated core domain-containing protein [Vibrio neonatus]|uniref:RHS repeat-associated core domain-containing protein n=1 Tax=Vibrio neonatus TaxID=278860 RepID=UPI0021C3C36A|nr:RHS repeat-associated core domain-containing protein [Vibrio neonatus]
MRKLFGLLVVFFLLEYSDKRAYAVEISVLTECQGALSCNGPNEPNIPDNDDDDSNNNGGDLDDDFAPDPVDVDRAAIESAISGITSTTIDVAGAAGLEADRNADAADTQTADTQSDNEQQQQQASEASAEGDESDCPVELYSGCKITREIDYAHPVFSLVRQHRISQGSAWSLGAGWHSSLDSRIIWGVDVDIQPLIELNQASVNQYQTIIDGIDQGIDKLSNSFTGRLAYNEEQVQQRLSAAISELQAQRAIYIASRDQIQTKINELTSQHQQSNYYRERNRYVVDTAYPIEYEIGLHKLKWVAPNGSRKLFSVEPSTSNITPIMGHNTHLEIDENGFFIVSTPKGVTYQYNYQGFLVKVNQNDGRSVTIYRDSQQQPIRMVDGLGRALSFTYTDGRLTEITDQEERTHSYTYLSGKLSDVVQFNGAKHHYQYAYQDNPLALTLKSDGEGNSAFYLYRQQDNKTVVDTQIDPSGNQFSYEYDFPNRTTTVLNRNNTRTRYQYNAHNQILSKVYESDGSEIHKVYDDKGNLIVEYDELGHTTLYSYDLHGRVISTTDPMGRSTDIERDAAGRILSTINNIGDETQFVYDNTGRVESIELADGSVVEEHWLDNVLIRRIDEVGNYTEYQYDDLGYPIRIEQFAPQTPLEQRYIRETQFDKIGRIIKVAEGSRALPQQQWRVTHYEYHSDDGRDLDSPTRIIDPLGRESIMQYDSNGLLTYQQDFSGVKTYLTYTPRNKISTKKVLMPSLTGETEYVTQYHYDSENNLVSVTLPHGAVWQYQYDSRNRLIHSSINGTEVSKSYTYDASGNRIAETDSLGSTTHFQYYPDSQLQSTTNPIGNVVEHYYDDAGRQYATYDHERAAYVKQYGYNELGHIIESSDGNGNATYFTPNALGLALSVSMPNSTQERIRHDYNWQGLSTSYSDASGGEYLFEYNVFGQVVLITDSEGGVERFQYDGLGRKTLHINKSGLQTQWQYDQQASQLVVTQIQSDTDKSIMLLGNHRQSNKVYDLLGRLIEYKDAAEQRWQFEYNQQGLLSSIIYPDSSQILRHYNLAGLMTAEIVTTQGQQSRESYFTYDGEGRLSTEQLPYYRLGSANTYRYNDLGLLSSMTMPDGASYQFYYDMAGRKVSEVNPLGHQQSWEYDANDNVVSYTDGDDYRWHYTYNADNQIVQVIDPENGHHASTEYAYDAMGRLTSSSNQLGHTQHRLLDSLGRLIGAKDAAGNMTHIRLDNAGRPMIISNRLGEETQQQYDAFDQLISQTNPLGHTTHFEYDVLGRKSHQTNALNAGERWGYNFRNQVTDYSNQLNQTTRYQYDGFGNISEIKQANNSVTRYAFNAANKLASITSAAGTQQSFSYDDMARLTTFTNELGEQWRYDYDLAGQVTHAYQPEQNTDIQFQYDQRGHVTERQYAHQGQWHSEVLNYDGLGRLANIDGPELAENYHYDPAGRLIQVDNRKLGQSFNYEYNVLGERTYSQVSDDEGVYYHRDAEGKIVKLERNTADGNLAFELSYDASGQLQQIDYPNRSRRSLEYDAVGRIVSIVIEQQEYKGNRWRDTWNTIEVLNYQYDGAGNVTAQNRKTEHGDSDQWAYFEYDQVNRIVSADYPNQDDIEFSWDDVGNLTQKQTKTTTYTYSYNQANQLVEMQGHRLPGFSCDDNSCENDDSSDSHNFVYQYDANGNLASVSNGNEVQSYQHDPLNRMTEVINPDGSSVQYGYDVRSRRVKTVRTAQTAIKQNGNSNQSAQLNQTTLYSHYDGRQEQGQWQDNDAGFTPFRSLTLLPDSSLPYGKVLHQSLYDSTSSLVQASGTKGADPRHLYNHHDRLGSTIHVLDSTGTSAMRLGYSPFGQTYRKHNDKTFWKANAGVNANKQLGQLMPYQYTGKYTESSTGLVNLDARWYNPHSSRFIQPDYWSLKDTYLPTEIQHELIKATSLNTDMLLRDPNQQMSYGYGSGNPFFWVDPFGLAVLVLSGESSLGAGTLVSHSTGLAVGIVDGDLKVVSYHKVNIEIASSLEATTGLSIELVTGTNEPADLSGISIDGSINVGVKTVLGGVGSSVDIDAFGDLTFGIGIKFGPGLSGPANVSSSYSKTIIGQDLTEVDFFDRAVASFNKAFEKTFIRSELCY